MMTIWRRWMRQPQTVWLRKALFQVHLWSGIGVGLYILVIGVTGSVLVYRVEIMRKVTPKPIVATPSGARLTDEQLQQAAMRAFPGFRATDVRRARNLDQSVDVSLTRGKETKKRMFDPYTGKDLGDTVPFAISFVSWLLDLHDNLLYGRTGRLVNGIGAIFTTVLALTGLIIWWPGVQKWRRSLTLHRRVGWKRFTWDLHSAVGIWTFGFVLLFGVTGVYLTFPEPISDFADILEPPTDANGGRRIVDTVMFWLARVHFGRFGGWSTKLIWAVFGLAPAFLFVTGAIMWWNRVVSPAMQVQRSSRRVERHVKRREAIRQNR
jgi:uncharacterized iron-regulated membrane protein